MGYQDIIERLNATAIERPDEVAQVISGVISESAVLSMATRLPDISSKKERIPVLGSLPQAFFVNGDNGLIQTTKALWDKKYIDAEKIACIIPVPKDVFNDSSYNLWAQIEPRLKEAFGKVIDGAAIFGTNKPSTAPDGIVKQAIDAGNVVDIPATDADIVELIGGESGVMAKVERFGFDVNGNVADVGVKSKLRGLKTQDGQLVFQPSMQAGTPSVLFGNSIMYLKNGAFDTSVARMIAGDFSQLMYAFRQQLEFSISDSGVLTDADGKVVHNLFQEDMIALKATMRLGWNTPNPISALNANRAGSPFAVLRNHVEQQGG